ncbi:hypothetical protein [Mesorhizobium sophorae]|uniref:hypothetical protein n=1 Tax=Mesorhizobium sophorae TaxID=1300294 RepID=UPI00117DDD56|nr:hypothetical protein [Mesorhizobium sophorae]
MSILDANPELRDLLPLIATLYRTQYRSAEHRELPESVFHDAIGDNSDIAASIAMLNILEGKTVANKPATVQTLLASDLVPVSFLLRALSRDSEQQNSVELALAIAREVLTRRRVQASGVAYEILGNAVDARPVPLTQAAIADRLELPQALAPPSSAVSL